MSTPFCSCAYVFYVAIVGGYYDVINLHNKVRLSLKGIYVPNCFLLYLRASLNAKSVSVPFVVAVARIMDVWPCQ